MRRAVLFDLDIAGARAAGMQAICRGTDQEFRALLGRGTDREFRQLPLERRSDFRDCELS